MMLLCHHQEYIMFSTDSRLINECTKWNDTPIIELHKCNLTLDPGEL